MRRSLTVALLATIAGSAAAWAARADWVAVESLPPGSEIRITIANGKTLRGFLLKTTTDSLTINATTSQEVLARSYVKRVHLKRQGRRGRNTLLGLGIGAGGGLALGAGFDAKMNDDWFPNAGKAVLAPLGAIIGTVVGVAIPTGGWRELYRAP